MWSRSELETALREAGPGSWAPRLAKLARHSILLLPGSDRRSERAPGSKLPRWRAGPPVEHRMADPAAVDG